LFAFNKTTLDVSDSERGFVLKQISGSSDGTAYFKLSGTCASYEFSAHMLTEKASRERWTQLGIEDQDIPMVWVIHNWNEEWIGLIREAMLALENGRIEQGKVLGIDEDVRHSWTRAIAIIEFAGENV
jgi:hypothetical protein